MPLTMRSMRSGSTGRLRSATSTERCELVAVERHAPARALDDRQLAQLHPLEGGEAAAAIRADAAAADGGRIVRRAASPSPGCRGCRNRGSASAAHPDRSRRRSGKRRGQLVTRCAFTVASTSPLPSSPFFAKPVEHLDDQLADLPELGDAEAARGRGRRAEADARGDHRLLGIERHAVLVAGDVGAAERRLGGLAGQASWAAGRPASGGCRCRRRRWRSRSTRSVSASALAFSTTARA